jgi:hypothetical protein
MTELDVLAWLAALGVGGMLTTLITWLTRRSLQTAEVDSMTVHTAETVVEMVHRQLASMEAEITELRVEIGVLRLQVGVLSDELHNLGGDPDHVLSQVSDGLL